MSELRRDGALMDNRMIFAGVTTKDGAKTKDGKQGGQGQVQEESAASKGGKSKSKFKSKI